MKIVIDDLVFNYKEIFSEFGDIYPIPGKNISNKDVIDADILIIRSRTKVNKELLQNSRVKFIGSVVSGTDHIDLEYLAKTNTKLADARGSNANSVAEYIIANILNVANKFGFCYKDKTLGIIGVGNIGTILARKAESLGIKTLLNDPPRGDVEDNKDLLDLDFVLKNSDILSFNTPLNKTGKHPSFNLLGKHNFDLVAPDTIIFNTCRGGVINQKQWLKHSGIKIIDCWQNEPNISQELLARAEIATQHIAGHSIDAKFNGSIMVYNSLCDFVKITPKKYQLELLLEDLSNLDLLTAINKIYDFREDDKALRAGNFDNYRKNYPPRYEWQNYGIKII